MFFKIGVLNNFAIFAGKHLCWPVQGFFYRTPAVAASGFLQEQILQVSQENTLRSFFNRVADIFPLEFTKFIRTPNLKSAKACF